MEQQEKQAEPRALKYHEAWQRLWHAWAIANPEPTLLPALVQRYCEPHRHYHTLQHLDACFAHLASVRDQAAQPAEIELALWFHDAMYGIGAQDNELKSADWASASLQAAGVDADVARRVHALVMVTCHTALPQTQDEAILIDVDLAILGAPEPHFDAYERQVRAEYASVPLDQFRARRRRILQQFLERERIYHTAYFNARCEAQARANLRRSIARFAD